MKRYFGYKNSDNEGFTLAEVLITVGVIGVVAAMTIPTLMMDYQRKVWEARLKKSFSVTVNACERMLVEENVSASNETALYNIDLNAEGENVNPLGDANTIVRRYIKIIKDVENSDNGLYIALPDGADLYYTPVASNDASGIGPGFRFLVDVNGERSNPNQPGRDIFEFYLDRDCTYTYSAIAGRNEPAYDFNYVIENNWTIPADPAAYGYVAQNQNNNP